MAESHHDRQELTQRVIALTERLYTLAQQANQDADTCRFLEKQVCMRMRVCQSLQIPPTNRHAHANEYMVYKYSYIFFVSQVQKGEEELIELQQRMSQMCSVAELALKRLTFKLEEAAAAANAHRIRHPPTLLPTLPPCQRHKMCACLGICVCVAFMRLKTWRVCGVLGYFDICSCLYVKYVCLSFTMASIPQIKIKSVYHSYTYATHTRSLAYVLAKSPGNRSTSGVKQTKTRTL